MSTLEDFSFALQFKENTYEILFELEIEPFSIKSFNIEQKQEKNRKLTPVLFLYGNDEHLNKSQHRKTHLCKVYVFKFNCAN
jgi:hypothetical protein